jgi:hypothetical protein
LKRGEAKCRSASNAIIEPFPQADDEDPDDDSFLIELEEVNQRA